MMQTAPTPASATPRATTFLPPRDAIAAVNGVWLHYREWGAAGAPPVLILHGLTGHAREFDELAAALCGDYRVLALDQRGHGASEWADTYEPRVMARDVIALMDELEIGRARVIGHSMGGIHGWCLAAGWPQRIERLAFVDVDPTTVTTPATIAALHAALATFAAERFKRPEEAVQAYRQRYGGGDTPCLQRFVVNNLRPLEEGWGWRFDAAGLAGWLNHVSRRELELWRWLAKVPCPALSIRAGNSAFTSRSVATRVAAALPDGRQVEITGAGHDVHFDRLDALCAVLTDFLG